MIAYAQNGSDLAHTFVAQLNAIIFFPLIILLMVLAILYFMWGGLQFVLNANNETARAAGKRHMFWGIIGLLIMLSAYSILSITVNTIGVNVDDYNSSAPLTSPVPPPNPNNPNNP